jgi:hypothetical protein
MHGFRRIVIAVTAFLSLLAPTMACAFPNARMSAEEHSCCRQMKGRCGSMNMPASHNCCHKGMQAGHFEALQPRSPSFHPVITLAAALPAVALYTATPVVYQATDSPQHSPPTSPPILVSVLRI